MLREQCDELYALIPAMAHSAGTLIALGANNIIMTPFANVSPIDPNVANDFNPINDLNKNVRVAIPVEDMLAYLELARDNVGKRAYDAAFSRLTESLHPLSLGNAKRSVNMIRLLGKKMIRLHRPDLSDRELSAMVTTLTTEFYSHQHLIGREEAKNIGLPVADADAETEALLLQYWDELIVDLKLQEPFNPANIRRLAVATAGGAPGAGAIVPATQHEAERAYIETTRTCDAYVSRGEIGNQVIQGAPGQPQQNVIAFQTNTEQWEVLA